MDSRKGNSELDDDEVKKIDLTLKLGPSPHYSQNQEENKDDAACGRVNNMGNWNVEHNSSAAAAAVGGTNYLVYHQHQIQQVSHHNIPTTPTRKRPIVDDSKSCKACGSNTTPLWRKGPDGPQTLCNACGLRHLRTVKRAGEQ